MDPLTVSGSKIQNDNVWVMGFLKFVDNYNTNQTTAAKGCADLFIKHIQVLSGWMLC